MKKGLPRGDAPRAVDTDAAKSQQRPANSGPFSLTHGPPLAERESNQPVGVSEGNENGSTRVNKPVPDCSNSLEP
jgi:hypothetical protein